MVNNFYVRRTFLLPLGILLILALLLLITVVVQGQPTIKAVVLSLMLVPISGLFFESYFRRIHFDEESITVFKPFRKKSLKFSELTEVETLQVKKRVFLTLSTLEDFMIMSNAYADFPHLVNSILEHSPDKVITDETRKMSVDPPSKSSDIVSCWLAVLLMAIILALQYA
jgi:hypothetical protein